MSENYIELHEIAAYLQDKLRDSGYIATDDEVIDIVHIVMQYFVEQGIFDDFEEYEE